MTKLIPARCPGCGADIHMPGDRDRSYCTFCGGQVLLSRDVTHVHIGTGSFDNHMELGRRAYAVYDYESAMEHFEKALVYDVDNAGVNSYLNNSYLGHANVLVRRARAKRSAATQQMAAGARAGHVHIGMDDADFSTRQFLRQQAHNNQAYLNAQGEALLAEARELDREAAMYFMKAGVCPQCHGRTYCHNCKGRGWCPDCKGSGTRFLIMTCDDCRGSKICAVCRAYRLCVYCRGSGKYAPAKR